MSDQLTHMLELLTMVSAELRKLITELYVIRIQSFVLELPVLHMHNDGKSLTAVMIMLDHIPTFICAIIVAVIYQKQK